MICERRDHMSLMWVSVSECNQSHIYHLTQMIKDDENLQIVLSYGAPDMDRGDFGLLKRKTEQVLSQLGVPLHLKGCQYLKTAVELCIQNMEELEGITKRLYPDVARIHHTAGETVEHAIRHAIGAAWQRGDEGVQKKLFGYSRMEGKRPTNLEFIYRLADYLQDEEGKYLS